MLTKRDQRIVALRLTGTILTEIAAEVGCHRNTVRRTLEKPEVQAYFAQVSLQIEETLASETEQAVLSLQQQFDHVAQTAFNKLTELMQTAESEGVMLKSAESILDRSSLSPKRQIHQKHDVQQNVVVLHATAAWMEEAKEAMFEIGVDVSELSPINPDGETITLDRDTGKMVSSTPPHDPINIP